MESLRLDLLDTSSCEAEPIRYPGVVQPHGALLVVDPVRATMEAASESCKHLIGLGAQELLGQSLAGVMGKITGLDQVMIYRLDAHWHGEVIVEAAGPGIEPYQGLHFPASDIPKQARELFKECRVRLITDVHTPLRA
jgi:light-regulated signal transduction histidine kinase (bacteriophytochrome)